MTVRKTAELAIEGGEPVRSELLPYGRQWVQEEDIDEVVSTLRSDWLTTGPRVEDFERKLSETTGAAHAVSVSNGTAALHAAVHALGIGPGDEVIVPPLTFAATANAVVYEGATPVFADVTPDTLLLDPSSVSERITSRTTAIIAVDYAGQPAEYAVLGELARSRGLRLLADGAHSLGGSDSGVAVGRLADATTLSFHPVKQVTTAEGGAVLTDDAKLARSMRRFRNHGIETDHHQREARGTWFYEMVELGYNYRLSDLQCALGIAQLDRLPDWLDRRRRIAARYDDAFAGLTGVEPVTVRDEATSAYHLYVARFTPDRFNVDRRRIFAALRAEGIGVNVHYIPVHLHPYYRDRFGTGPGLCPVAESAYDEILSLPIFPRMTDADVEDVIEAVQKIVQAYGRGS